MISMALLHCEHDFKLHLYCISFSGGEKTKQVTKDLICHMRFVLNIKLFRR